MKLVVVLKRVLLFVVQGQQLDQQLSHLLQLLALHLL